MENKTHFKKLLNPKYLGSHDLEEGKEYKVTFEKITKEMVKDDKGKDNEKPIVYFKGASKPMILNSTNMKMTAKVLGSKFIEDWIGKSVIINVVQERSFGEMMDVIRVKNKQA